MSSLKMQMSPPFVVGSEQEWDDYNREKALRTVSRGSLSLTPTATRRLTPADVSKLAYVTSRSGRRIKTPSDNDPYWRELREKAQLAIPEGATHFFTKHFDPDQGLYYYYEHVSGVSTWDRPAGDVEVYRPESLVESMFEAHRVAAEEQRKLTARRRRAYDDFQRDKAENLTELWLDKEAEEKKRVENIWRVACVEATQQGGSLEISWKKLEFVNPLIYDFQTQFGMPLIGLKLVGIDLPALPDDVALRLPTLQVCPMHFLYPTRTSALRLTHHLPLLPTPPLPTAAPEPGEQPPDDPPRQHRAADEPARTQHFEKRRHAVAAAHGPPLRAQKARGGQQRADLGAHFLRGVDAFDRGEPGVQPYQSAFCVPQTPFPHLLCPPPYYTTRPR